MMTITDDEVIFSREYWEELRSDDVFRELVEIIEDREALIKAKAETEYFIDLDDYHRERLEREGVPS